MTSVDFMNPDEPNFIFKGINAVMDMQLIIENELPEISPHQRVEEIETLGRSGSLHEWFGDYAPYDFQVKDITCPYDMLAEVKSWLRGRGTLVTHNDPDKYRDVRCSTSSPTQFQNEWGVFYTFDITFRSQPFKKRLSEPTMSIIKGENMRSNPGQEISKPQFWIEATGGDFTITIGDRSLTVVNALPGVVEINTEFGKVTQEKSLLRKKGSWPISTPGLNEVILSGNATKGLMKFEAVYL